MTHCSYKIFNWTLVRVTTSQFPEAVSEPPYLCKKLYHSMVTIIWYTSQEMMTSHHVTITSWCQNSRHLGSAILEFKIFPKCQKTTQYYCKVHKISKTVLKNRKKVKKLIVFQLIFINRNTKITNLEKYAYKNAVAMVMSSSCYSILSYQIIPR